MNLDMQEFFAAFYEEAAEHLATLEEGLLRLESAQGDKELINSIFRAAHSIKGTGGALGFTEIAGFTHHIETVLDRMRDGKLDPTAQRVELLLQSTDALCSMIDGVKTGGKATDDIGSLEHALHQLVVGEPAPDDGDDVTLFDDPLETTADGAPSETTDVALLAQQAAIVVPAPAAQSETPVASDKPQRATQQNDSIRVSVGKIEELINLVGELVIANSMVQQAYASTDADRHELLGEALSGINRTTRQLQEQVMAVRMLPIASVFRRFPRIVHDLAGNLGKKVQLEIIGEDTELDKQVIEVIGDPLMHLVRNAVDHGLEQPDERLAAGKTPEGRMTLKAYHEGGNVIIEIADDGRGINPDRVRAKAIAQGLIAESDALTPDQIYQLILQPGFSTAERITDISGRGVGMDVVKRNVEALNGTIVISSTPGRGSCFKVRLPLTMAILDGLSLRLADEIYVLPLLSVVESLRPAREQLVKLAGNDQMVLVRGEALPLLQLPTLLESGSRATDPCQGLVVIVEHHGRKYGLVIDELIGQLQVVMKSLEANYQRVVGLSGATILGDGRVAFIIDVPELIRMAYR